MKIKLVSLLAIIGVILQLIPHIIWTLFNMKVLEYGDWSKYLNIILVIGTALLLPFFVTLYQNQKKQ